MENLFENGPKKELSIDEIKEKLIKINKELDVAGGVPLQTMREKNDLINYRYKLIKIVKKNFTMKKMTSIRI